MAQCDGVGITSDAVQLHASPGSCKRFLIAAQFPQFPVHHDYGSLRASIDAAAATVA